MSATPPNPPQGQTPPGGPNGPPLKMRRPKKAADPLVRPKKKPPPRPGQPSGPSANGKAVPPPRSAPIAAQNQQQPASLQKPNATPSASDLTVNGFNGPLLSETYVDYPLMTTKRAWREGLKFHVAKFGSKKNIDPRDEDQFTRPLRLQRRDPRATNAAAGAAAAGTKEENGERPTRGGVALTEAEREELEAKKQARAKEREENLAQIAPSTSSGGGGGAGGGGGSSGQKRANAMKQKTQQVFKAEMTPEEMAKARVRYEEALPWNLEDFDNKNLWVGNYQAAMSGTYAMFILDESGKMRMVPIDKWYKFSAKNQFRALTIEEAEKHMAKKVKDPRWFMEKEETRAQQKELAQYAQHGKLYTGRVEPGAAAGLGGDDMDFEEDRFADDEEHVGLFDEDEDAQLADKRIKNDQLKANVFDLKEEKEYDQEETQEKKEKEALKNYGKRVRKALQKREKNFDYSSGSDDNPFSEDESSEDTETERQKEEQHKSEEDPSRKNKGKDSERTSGASTRGTNTPSDRPKHTDALKKASNPSASVAAASATRKRPGSPNLSDASGTDTSRKRAKSKHPASTQAEQSQPASRPTSPTPSNAQTQRRKAEADVPKTHAAGKKRVRSGPGAGSDTDRAASGAEMSDSTSATAPKKLKLNLKPSKDDTSTGSRAGSPTPASGAGRGVPTAAASGGSRASSPDGVARGRTRPSTPRGSPSPPAAAAAAGTFPTASEIRATIPTTGISIGELIKLFKPRIGNEKSDRTRFISIIKEVSDFSLEDKLVRPKGGE